MPYTGLDYFIAKQRFKAAYAHIRPNSRVCDLGCGLETAFLNYAADRIAFGAGIDDQAEDSAGDGSCGRWRTMRADLRAPLPFPGNSFDHVVMLAVLEHLTEPEIILRNAFRILAPGGTLILTWPSSLVDPILNVLHVFHLISDEMESDEHQRRIPVDTLQQMLTGIGFKRFFHRRFELGLNNLMVASK